MAEPLVVRSAGRWSWSAVPAVAAAVCAVITACATAPPSPYSEGKAPGAALEGVEDRRGRFREIFCAVLDERGPALPDSRSCDEALTRLGGETEPTGRSVGLGSSERRLVAAIVEGVGWNCISSWLDPAGSAADHVRLFSYDLVTIDVESLSSSAANARRIRDVVMATEPEGSDPSLVLIGYSKGAPDILEAVVRYPEIRPRVAAVVSVAGAVGGSPVADEVTQSKLAILRHWPDAECSEGDGGAIESLRPATRRAWLAENTLPTEIPFYSLATCPEPERVSAALKPTYRRLRKIDARNDGMVLLEDQLVPGSVFLGCVNADHWAVSVPIARSHPNIAALFVDENDYPREALLEAILRFVEEDLGD